MSSLFFVYANGMLGWAADLATGLGGFVELHILYSING